MTEGKGGELYKQARAKRFRYAQEFEDHAVVNKMLSFKPGTKDGKPVAVRVYIEMNFTLR